MLNQARASAEQLSPHDQAEFRRALGHYPTGVCIVTAQHDDKPIGMTIGSFTSVSLDPPLVGFLPAHSSQTWPLIAKAGAFCVNILADDQSDLPGRFAKRDADRFQDIAHSRSSLDLPVFDGVVAWIDCTLHSAHEAGDHLFVMGNVLTLSVVRDRPPLLFCRGAFGGFVAGT
ncbi:flavin reductase family protein [Agrobacterium vitis]|uniref:flavin reductase family protein n=1 Tax=Agrobacterium vitis TaxID=373 RepID=UPI0015DA4FD8|nr:flavin reductase family protein [Agrobacterium vitis]MCF1452445.1 flavin reductase [Agrobacterium vitis]BCH56181.1 monooxygenase [Agrobacterium vitis]